MKERRPAPGETDGRRHHGIVLSSPACAAGVEARLNPMIPPLHREPGVRRSMTTVLLVIHIMVAAALVAVVLWQRSEGGALGIGGGGGGGFLTGRGTANLL